MLIKQNLNMTFLGLPVTSCLFFLLPVLTNYRVFFLIYQSNVKQ